MVFTRPNMNEEVQNNVAAFLAATFLSDPEGLEAALKNPSSFDTTCELLHAALAREGSSSRTRASLVGIAPVLVKALKHPGKSDKAAGLLASLDGPESGDALCEVLGRGAVHLAEATRDPGTAPAAYRIVEFLFGHGSPQAVHASESLLSAVEPEANRALRGRKASRFALEILVLAAASPRLGIADGPAVRLEGLERGILAALGKETGPSGDDAIRLLEACIGSAGPKTRKGAETILEKARKLPEQSEACKSLIGRFP